MKNYQKPNVDIIGFTANEKLSSLNDWLSSATGEMYQDAGVTTYLIES